MGAREDTVRLLRAGNSPAQISRIRGVTIGTTLPYLEQMAGRGAIRVSEIYFAVPSDTRELVDKVQAQLPRKPREHSDGFVEMGPVLDAAPHLDPGDVQVCLRYGGVGRYVGDLYALLRELELTLHDLVKSKLQEQYGTALNGWWVQGVPLGVRQACVGRREELGVPDADAWTMSTFIHLRETVDKQWGPVFSRCFRHPAIESKKQLLQDLLHVNEVRNAVMHPVRAFPLQEQHFDTVLSVHQQVVEATRSCASA